MVRAAEFRNETGRMICGFRNLERNRRTGCIHGFMRIGRESTSVVISRQRYEDPTFPFLARIISRMEDGAVPSVLANAIPWEEYRVRLVVFARLFGGVAAESPEDAAHEIVAKAIARSDTYHEGLSFTTWLYGIARNHCIDLNRKRNRRDQIMLRGRPGIVALQRTSQTPEEVLERDETGRAVATALGLLRPGDRRIVYLRFYEDLPLADIAHALDLPVGTVKYRLHVSTKRLHRMLEEFVEENG